MTSVENTKLVLNFSTIFKFNKNIIRMMKSTRMRYKITVCITRRDMTNAFKRFIENFESNRSCGSPRNTWKGTIKI
jgi:hypothetical protein